MLIPSNLAVWQFGMLIVRGEQARQGCDGQVDKDGQTDAFGCNGKTMQLYTAMYLCTIITKVTL